VYYTTLRIFQIFTFRKMHLKIVLWQVKIFEILKLTENYYRHINMVISIHTFKCSKSKPITVLTILMNHIRYYDQGVVPTSANGYLIIILSTCTIQIHAFCSLVYILFLSTYHCWYPRSPTYTLITSSLARSQKSSRPILSPHIQCLPSIDNHRTLYTLLSGL